MARCLWADFVRLDLFRQGSAMAYVTLLSIVPSLAAIFTLVSAFTPALGKHGAIFANIKTFVIANLAQGSGEQVAAVLDSFIDKINLAQIGISSFAGLLVTLTLLLRQIELALNRIWQVAAERHILARFVYFWTFLTLGGFVASLAVGFWAAMDWGIAISTTGEGIAHLAASWLSEFMTLLATMICFFLLYKIVPNCKVPATQALVGAVVAGVLFRVAGKAFGLYVNLFSGMQAIYGALGGLPLFLTWLYISWLVILFGGVVSWRLQQGFPIQEGFGPVPREKRRR